MVRGRQTTSSKRNSPVGPIPQNLRGLRTYSQSQSRGNTKRPNCAVTPGTTTAEMPNAVQTETPQREKVMKLRKPNQPVQPKSEKLENGKLRSGSSSLRAAIKALPIPQLIVRRTVPPRKASTPKEEVQDDSKDETQASDPVVNGTETVTPSPAKVKLEVEFEDSDEDDDDEGLKKVMENIEKDLSVAEDLKKGVIKRPLVNVAPINDSWLEFGDKSVKKLKVVLQAEESRDKSADSEPKGLGKRKENGIKECNGDQSGDIPLAADEDNHKEPISAVEVQIENDKTRDMRTRAKKKVFKKTLSKEEKSKELSDNTTEPSKKESSADDQFNKLSTSKDSSAKAPSTKSVQCVKNDAKDDTTTVEAAMDDEDPSESIVNLLEISEEMDSKTVESDDDQTPSVSLESKVTEEDSNAQQSTDYCGAKSPPSSQEATSSPTSKTESVEQPEESIVLDDSDSTIVLEAKVDQEEDLPETLDNESASEAKAIPALPLPTIEDCKTELVEDDVAEPKTLPTREKRKAETDGSDIPELVPFEKKVKLDTKEETKEVESGIRIPSPPVPSRDLVEDKKKEPTYKLTKAELEMLVICKVSEYFTDANKSEIGVLRRRCEQFDKIIDQWRRKANLYQKQITDLQIALQRAQTNKRFLGQGGPKPPMRSVGLQVQLTRYVHTEPSKMMSRVPGVISSHPKQNTSGPVQPPSYNGQPIVLPKHLAGNQMAFVTNLGSTGALNGTTLVSKGTSINHVGSQHVAGGTTPSKVRAPIPIVQKNSLTPTKSASSQVGQVSLLQPRTSAGMVITTQLPASNLSSASGGVTGSGATSSKLRTALDPPKMNASNSTPVPMRLIPNQAVRHLAPASSSSTPTVSNASNRAVTVSMIGQPPLVTNAVKIIDLTADEEDAAKQAAAAAAAVGTQTASVTTNSNVTTGTTISNMSVVSSLPSGASTVTVLTPATSGSQILTLASPVGGMVSGATTMTTPSQIRMAQPVRAGTTPIVNSGPVRLAYLMSPTSMVTMMRPNQPLFVAPSPGVRPGQPSIMRPALPTIVLQRGTTLLPLQQSQVAQLPNLRPATSTQGPRTSTPTTTVVPVSVIGGPTVIRPALSTTVSTSTIATLTTGMNVAAAMASAPQQVTYTRSAVPTSPTQTAKSFSVTKTIIAQQSGKHPAPLPAMAAYTDMPGRKALPPKPALRISKVSTGIVLSWNMCLNLGVHAEISSYQLFAYQEGSAAPSTQLWKKVGDVKALPLPMACTLTQFMEGHKYYFAVRAMDVHNRLGPFSDPGGITLVAAAVSKSSPVKS